MDPSPLNSGVCASAITWKTESMVDPHYLRVPYLKITLLAQICL